MAFYDTTWYAHFGDGSTTGYYAVPQRVTAAATAVSAGALVRQFTAPAIGSERVFICIIAGTTANATDATWVLTRGAKTVDGTVTWQECTGAAPVNGDFTNTATWSQAKATGVPTLGAIIRRNGGSSYQICTTAGTLGASEPAFSDTPGVTTTETSATTVWTCIGPVGNFGIWAAPHARLLNAMTATWGVNGHDFYVADNSAETTTAATSLQIGVNGFASRIMSIDHTASLPANAAALKVGASITSSFAGNNAIIIGNANTASSYWYGFIFTTTGSFSGSPMIMGAGASSSFRFDNCSFRLGGGNAGSLLDIGFTATAIDLNNCTFGLTNAAQIISFGGGNIAWRNTPDPCFLTGSIGGQTYVLPTVAMRGLAAVGGNLLAEGVDLTSLGSSALVSVNQGGGAITFKNCKMHTGNVMSGIAASGEGALTVDVVNSDSGGHVYRNERYSMYGTIFTSIGVVRSGGATDGSTPVSHNITPNATYSKPYRPFNCIPLVIWNDVVGMGRSLTVYGMMPGSTNQPLPYNDQFWIDVEYMGDASTPNASLVSTGLPTQLTPHSQIAVADGSSWPSIVGTTFALTATFTAQQRGYVTVYPRSAGSLAFYLDPKPVLGSSIWSTVDAALFTGTVITNNGLTFATPTGAPSGGLAALRGTISHVSGKYYVEYLCTTSLGSIDVSAGLADAGADMTTNLSNSNYGAAWELYGSGNPGLSSGFSITGGTLPSYAPVAGDVIQIAVNFTAGNIWWGLNNVWYNSGNPAAGTGALATIGSPVLGAIPLFPALGVYVPVPSGPWTLQAVPANQTYAPPSGFLAWG